MFFIYSIHVPSNHLSGESRIFSHSLTGEETVGDNRGRTGWMGEYQLEYWGGKGRESCTSATMSLDYFHNAGARKSTNLSAPGVYLFCPHRRVLQTHPQFFSNPNPHLRRCVRRTRDLFHPSPLDHQVSACSSFPKLISIPQPT
jgi:hypothetical protein